ncbi:hypothetical protein L208DRAFT_1419010 [Tricholoma matsutake]|nr:hypothetical protein L208DRAFT_1419010 [Tricholoma matsutake 945]
MPKQLCYGAYHSCTKFTTHALEGVLRIIGAYRSCSGAYHSCNIAYRSCSGAYHPCGELMLDTKME